MKKETGEDIMATTRKLTDMGEQLLSICERDFQKNDPERIKILKAIGEIFSIVYTEISEPVARDFPQIGKKYFPHSPFSTDQD